MLAARGPRAGRPPRRRRLRPQGCGGSRAPSRRAARRGLRRARARRRAGGADGAARSRALRRRRPRPRRARRLPHGARPPGRRRPTCRPQRRPDRRAVRAPDAGDRRRRTSRGSCWRSRRPSPSGCSRRAPTGTCGPPSRRGWPAPTPSDAAALDHYAAVFTPDAIAAWCAEYRAAFHLDRPLDAADRAAGRTIACPVLVHWGAEETGLADALDVWRRWAADVRGGPVPGGHFVAEEAPDELAASLAAFLAG